MQEKPTGNESVSVIISSYKGNEQVAGACVHSLEAQTEKPGEVLVILDTENEKEAFRDVIRTKSIPVKILASGASGLVAARNKGIEESSGNIIAFIDDDAEADKGWVRRMIDSFSSNPDAVMVGGRAIPRFQGKPIPQSLNWIVGCTSEDPPTTRPIGCNMAFRREVFDKIGKFNEDLVMERKGMGISEETELILRIKRDLPGAAILYDPDIIVYHHVPERRTKLGYILKRAFAEGGAKAYTTKRYGRDVETTYLRYYLSHLDFLTFLVLCSMGLGYVKGLLGNR
jgi:GT2 family glycosyltransferase